MIPARRIVGHINRDPEKGIHEAHAYAEVLFRVHGWVHVDVSLGLFGLLSDRHFSRVREGSISERPMVNMLWKSKYTEGITVEESINIGPL